MEMQKFRSQGRPICIKAKLSLHSSHLHMQTLAFPSSSLRSHLLSINFQRAVTIYSALFLVFLGRKAGGPQTGLPAMRTSAVEGNTVRSTPWITHVCVLCWVRRCPLCLLGCSSSKTEQHKLLMAKRQRELTRNSVGLSRVLDYCWPVSRPTHLSP